MSNSTPLILEILSGPSDGANIELSGKAAWTKTPGSPLSFPWDEELGEPQATFSPEARGWTLIPHHSSHHTYRMNTEERVETKIFLAAGDTLKASRTWLLVK